MKTVIACLALIIFSFSLQSFNGIQIEKRHYRKGYYIHICHAPKTHPVYAETSREEVVTNVKAEKEKDEPMRAVQQRDDNAPARNIAPVSLAPQLKN